VPARACGKPAFRGTPGGYGTSLTRGGRSEEMAKTIRDVMTPNPRTASSSQSLTEAAQMMKNEDAGSLPVLAQSAQDDTVTKLEKLIPDLMKKADVPGVLIALIKTPESSGSARLVSRTSKLWSPSTIEGARKSRELNPNNSSAIEMLERFEAD